MLTNLGPVRTLLLGLDDVQHATEAQRHDLVRVRVRLGLGLGLGLGLEAQRHDGVAATAARAPVNQRVQAVKAQDAQHVAVGDLGLVGEDVGGRSLLEGAEAERAWRVVAQSVVIE